MRRTAPVTVALQGGLGNQLFQWAFATTLVSEGIPVRVDTVRCRGDRPLMLGRLLDGFLLGSKPGSLARAALERYVPSLLRVVRESGVGYDAQAAQRARHAGRYVLGYFQSPRYFADVAPFVRASVRASLSEDLTAPGGEMATHLERVDSVAVHVRRGDYVSNPTTAAHHGALDVQYYQRALAPLRARGATVIWFSDDLSWTRTHLAERHDLLCDVKLTRSARGEIALMSSCRSRIIANSSFSWWAGWLGPQPTEGGQVFAPLRWFADHHVDISDLIPEGWVTLP